MEQETTKRTRNFSLRKIHVGDWVQVWMLGFAKYTTPAKVTDISDNGSIFFKLNDGQSVSFQCKIENVDMIPITEEILLGFGFKLREPQFNISDKELKSVYWRDTYIGHLHKQNTSCILRVRGAGVSFVHELQELFEYNNMEIELKWKG